MVGMAGDMEGRNEDGTALEFQKTVLETMKSSQGRKDPPLVWAMEVAKCVGSRGFALPSPELGEALVSHLFSHLSCPEVWKFLNQALTSRLVSALHVLSLLAPRLLSCRQLEPEAYRLYLELISRYIFTFESALPDASKDKIIASVDTSLGLSQTYRIHIGEFGHAFVLFFFSVLVALIDSTMEDWGLQIKPADRSSCSPEGGALQQTDRDLKQNQNEKITERREWIRRTNSIMALEVLERITESKKATVLLRLIRLNMPEKFNGLLQRLQILEGHNLTSTHLKSAEQVLVKLSANISRSLASECQLNKRSAIGKFIDLGSCKLPCCSAESALCACWVAFDIYMESAMDAKQLPVTSAVDILTETVITLQVLNRASWGQTFLALWLSALRLVQRECNPAEGPIPHLEARLCVLLSIVPLAIVNIMKADVKLASTYPEDANTPNIENPCGHEINEKPHASKTHGLILSLQELGQFSGLLIPPESVVHAANNAAAKAACVILTSNSHAGGNMRHLIVEACIARKLIDTSAYFWPGYVSASLTSPSDASLKSPSPWASFMDGAQLTGSLISSLINDPAESFAEIEKLYQIALNGSEEEKSAAAKILCGASLSRGWNIQEHVVDFVLKLLSPPVPPNHNGKQNHLVDHISMLSAILFGASSIDTVHILSLHGVVPEVAAALMPLCEAFGSVDPTSCSTFGTCDGLSVYMVFSAAFLFLLRLWKFHRPPIEQGLRGGEGAIGGVLTLEYLLLLRNSRILSASCGSTVQEELNSISDTINPTSDRPMYIDSFPKLRAWYCQNKICVASTLSGLSSGNPVHEVANKIISMIYWKMTKGGTSSANSTPSSGSSGGSPPSSGEEPYQRPLLPAWEMLEAIPFALESILTACAYGRLSSRDLTTGLRDLVDFLPASVAAIISYFAAEVTRGIWKLVPMNGTDWPSPAQMLPTVESEIKQILESVGVDFPSYPSAVTPMLPLPMAALVSLTITFKLDKSLEYIHAVVGPALENCTTGSPWPSMPIISSLWVQKVRRWHNFIVISCSRSVFRQNKEAITQLLRSCFTSYLGICGGSGSNRVNGLLGCISDHGALPSLAPGFLYLRSCGIIQDPMYINDLIVGLVTQFSRDLAAPWVNTTDKRLRSNQPSLSFASARAKEVASLGSSLLCAAGGIHIVQELFRETIPTWLLTTREDSRGESNSVSSILEGYAMAYLVMSCGACAFGIRDQPALWALSRSARAVGVHMDFLAGVIEGKVSVGCNSTTWKTYISCLVVLMVNFAPTWVREVKLETLGKIASWLRGWHEYELALALLERGGVPGMALVANLLSVLD